MTKTGVSHNIDEGSQKGPSGMIPLVSFFLLIPASLTLGTGDPLNPSFIGIFMAVASLLVFFCLFKSATTLAPVFSFLIFLASLLTFFRNPMGLVATDRTPAFGLALYFLVGRAGGAMSLSVIAFVTALIDLRSDVNAAAPATGRADISNDGGTEVEIDLGSDVDAAIPATGSTDESNDGETEIEIDLRSDVDVAVPATRSKDKSNDGGTEIEIDFQNCPHCGVQRMILMDDGRCPNCKKVVKEVD